ADRAEPAEIAVIIDRAERRGAARDMGPVEVALQAQNPLADLVIIADRAAREAAVDAESRGCEAEIRVGMARGAETPAAVDADVEAGPIVGLHGGVGRSLGRITLG